MLRKLRVLRGRPGAGPHLAPAELHRDLLNGKQERIFLRPGERALDVLAARALPCAERVPVRSARSSRISNPSRLSSSCPAVALAYARASPRVSNRLKSAGFVVATLAPSATAAAAIMQSIIVPRRRPESFEQSCGDGSHLLRELGAPADDQRGERQSRLVDGTAQEFRPGDHAHADRLVRSNPFPKPPVFGRAANQRPDEEARVEVDHAGAERWVRCAPARRSCLVRTSQTAAAPESRARRLCSRSSASSPSLSVGSSCFAAVCMARRSAADLEVFQRFAKPSSWRTVSTSSE